MREIDVEKLLHWAFCDELPKKQISAAEGVWDSIQEYGQHGGIDPGHGAAQRYAHFGLPDPDAEAVERAVAGLKENLFIDWPETLPIIAGEIAGLVSVNDFERRPEGNPGKKTVAGWKNKSGKWQTAESRPRDILMLGALKPKALVLMYASQRRRPDWREENPTPGRIPAARSGNAKVVGECEGHNRYSLGAYCPLDWSPSPMSVIMARAEYVAWWEALHEVADTVVLKKHIALPPSAPAMPWFDPQESVGSTIFMPPVPGAKSLPLAPLRGRMLSPFRRPKGGPVQHLYGAEAGQ